MGGLERPPKLHHQKHRRIQRGFYSMQPTYCMVFSMAYLSACLIVNVRCIQMPLISKVHRKKGRHAMALTTHIAGDVFYRGGVFRPIGRLPRDFVGGHVQDKLGERHAGAAQLAGNLDGRKDTAMTQQVGCLAFFVKANSKKWKPEKKI